MSETESTTTQERYTINVIVRPTRQERHGFVVIEDALTGDNAEVFTGPDALTDATRALSRLRGETERCAMQIHPDGVVTVYDHRADWVARTFAGPDAVYAATGFMIKEEY